MKKIKIQIKNRFTGSVIFEYESDSFDENWQNECSNGIHFFITRVEAENY